LWHLRHDLAYAADPFLAAASIPRRLLGRLFKPCIFFELVDKLVYMKTVGAFDAKTHLNQLLQKVSQGETIRITRRGVPIAKLVPADFGERQDPRALAQEIREARKGANLGKTTIRELINEGRRF
jgi:prevent-host-death family protein